MLFLGTKTHHMLDTRAVIPTAVEEYEFLGCRQLGDVTLKVPCAKIPIRRLAERYHAGFTWAQVLDNALDAAVLSGRVTSFQQHQNLVAAAYEVALQLDKLHL